jgi:uncharacterized protein
MINTTETIFRDYKYSDHSRSDRSAGDRSRHRQIVKGAIKDGIVDIIADESIIGQSRDKVIKVPIQSKKEFRFVYGDNGGGVGTGDGNSKTGQKIGETGEQGPGKGQGKGGSEKGADVYETEVTLAEILDLLFDELQLPNLKKTNLKEIIQKSALRKDGYRKVGIPVRLDRKKTAIQRIKRKKAMERHSDLLESCAPCDGFGFTCEWIDSTGWLFNECQECAGTGKIEQRIRFRNEDRVYRHMDVDPKPQSNAAIIFVIDTSGSMDQSKKFLAKSFFFLLYTFIKAKYDKSELVFIKHETEAKEVTEDQFFKTGESGGTLISSGLEKAIEVINNRYSPTLWNNYVCYAGDGDNFDSDNPKAIAAMKELAELCSLVGYGEVKPNYSSSYESSMMERFSKALDGIKNYRQYTITSKDDIWSRLVEFLSIDEKAIAA